MSHCSTPIPPLPLFVIIIVIDVLLLLLVVVLVSLHEVMKRSAFILLSLYTYVSTLFWAYRQGNASSCWGT